VFFLLSGSVSWKRTWEALRYTYSQWVRRVDQCQFFETTQSQVQMPTVSRTRLRDEPAAQLYVAAVTAVEASSLPSLDDIKPPSGRITMPVSHVQSSLVVPFGGQLCDGYRI
jgi:hypothetical protein